MEREKEMEREEARANLINLLVCGFIQEDEYRERLEKLNGGGEKVEFLEVGLSGKANGFDGEGAFCVDSLSYGVETYKGTEDGYNFVQYISLDTADPLPSPRLEDEGELIPPDPLPTDPLSADAPSPPPPSQTPDPSLPVESRKSTSSMGFTFTKREHSPEVEAKLEGAPERMRALIIGKNGSVLKDIEQKTITKITIRGATVSITGLRHNVQNAIQTMEDIVEGNYKEKTSQYNLYLKFLKAHSKEVLELGARNGVKIFMKQKPPMEKVAVIYPSQKLPPPSWKPPKPLNATPQPIKAAPPVIRSKINKPTQSPTFDPSSNEIFVHFSGAKCDVEVVKREIDLMIQDIKIQELRVDRNTYEKLQLNRAKEINRLSKEYNLLTETSKTWDG
eukprot:TRINITY_DN4934_c0_g1_i2.p1 TRINITY_DN4934_c0_g1~~TRINITY_DN4934_c0_g1_i2.p1  ORF type:complete len:391 (-),score=113.65 TRINITY_DN4934_c0_g1_i2:416-1588(-)